MKILILFLWIVNLFGNVYILNSSVNKKRYQQLKLDFFDYEDRLKQIQKIIKQNKSESKIIDEDELNKLTQNDTLFLIDAFAISKQAQNKIIKFVAEGGVLVFNFKSAFLDEQGNLTQKTFLEKLTKLQPLGFGYKPKQFDVFVVQHLLSPIKIPNTKIIDFIVYDTIPFFKGKTPDLEFTNYTATSPLRYNHKYIPSGALWDGKYKKGGWIYFSFPFYVMTNKEWKEVFSSIVKYALNKKVVVKYPYLIYDKMTFISEDTEYKYPNFVNFINALNKYDLNGTAFCVGKLAKKYPALMNKAGELENLEIASHSYSHTKLIDKTIQELDKIEINGNNKLLSNLSNQEIKGFRPPREELNKKMVKVIETSSIEYVLAKYLEQLRPKYIGNLMLFSRMGTDDYQYLMELDWNKEKIINRMIEEVDYITSLNGLYTMSTHTHLMCYKSNVKMLEGLLKHIKQKKYPALKGKDIAKLIYQTDNIFINTTKDSIIIENKNKEKIKKFKFRIYYLTSPIKIKSPIKIETIQKDNYIDVTIFNLSKKVILKLE